MPTTTPTHKTATRAQWLAARMTLLEAEKELTRRSDELAAQRQALPWVVVDQDYRFESEAGTVSLLELFQGRSQLLIYHFMFGADYTAGCPSCSAIADGFNGSVVHLANHDVTLMAVSRAPLQKLMAYRSRMGWSFPWASSHGSDFNLDFHVSLTAELERAGTASYNYQPGGLIPATGPVPEVVQELAACCGTDGRTYVREMPGMSAFVREKEVVYHAYSTYARGLDAIWGMYPWLDRAPLGRNEAGIWWRRHDEYQPC